MTVARAVARAAGRDGPAEPFRPACEPTCQRTREGTGVFPPQRRQGTPALATGLFSALSAPSSWIRLRRQPASNTPSDSPLLLTKWPGSGRAVPADIPPRTGRGSGPIHRDSGGFFRGRLTAAIPLCTNTLAPKYRQNNGCSVHRSQLVVIIHMANIRLTFMVY